MSWTFAMALMLAGCGKGEDTALGPCDRVGELDWEVQALGPAPWDPIDLDLDAPACGYPFLDGDEAMSIIDEDGAETSLERDLDCNEDHWVAPGGLEPGRYVELVVHDVDHGPDGIADVHYAFERVVGSYGREPDFDAAGLVGQAFVVDPHTVGDCSGALQLTLEFLPGDLWVEIRSVEEGQVDFVAMQELPGGSACVYLEDTAELSATGELSWSRDALELSTDPLLPAHDLSMHLGFDADYRVAGMELGGTVDLVHMTGMQGDVPLYWEDYCELTAAFGLPCGACPDHERASCARLDYLAAQASPAELPWDSGALPDCQVALETDLPSCDLGCSAMPRQQWAFAVLGLAGLALLRRRRRGGRVSGA
jgi:MYXO-CTERM domain-containing protein